MSYQRVALKLSGEQFMGVGTNVLDFDFLVNLSKQLKKVAENTNAEVVVIVGGGNIMRGISGVKAGIDRVNADYMGIIATVINGIALVSTLQNQGQPASLVSKFNVATVEAFNRDQALAHLKKGILVVAGGTGNPYVTTDTAVVVSALELGCQLVLKATKVDGVYSEDPVQNKDAKKFEQLTYKQVLENPAITVMDYAAVALAQDNKLPIIVCDLKGDNLENVIKGEKVGTLISDN